MNVPALKFGCQTFTWEMLGEAWTGGPDDLVAAIADGGYAGIEITDTMIGSYAGRAADFARRLDDAGLALVAFAFGSDGGFTERGADPPPISRPPAAGSTSRRTFPGPWFRWGRPRSMSEGARDDKFAVAAEIYNRAAEIGRAAGVDRRRSSLVAPQHAAVQPGGLRPDLRPAGAAGGVGARHRPHPARRAVDRRHAGGASGPHPLRASQGRGRAGHLGDAGRGEPATFPR